MLFSAIFSGLLFAWSAVSSAVQDMFTAVSGAVAAFAADFLMGAMHWVLDPVKWLSAATTVLAAVMSALFLLLPTAVQSSVTGFGTFLSTAGIVVTTWKFFWACAGIFCYPTVVSIAVFFFLQWACMCFGIRVVKGIYDLWITR